MWIVRIKCIFLFNYYICCCCLLLCLPNTVSQMNTWCKSSLLLNWTHMPVCTRLHLCPTPTVYTGCRIWCTGSMPFPLHKIIFLKTWVDECWGIDLYRVLTPINTFVINRTVDFKLDLLVQHACLLTTQIGWINGTPETITETLSQSTT